MAIKRVAQMKAEPIGWKNRKEKDGVSKRGEIEECEHAGGWNGLQGMRLVAINGVEMQGV